MVKGVKITFEKEGGNTASKNLAICHNKKKERRRRRKSCEFVTWR